MNALNCRRRRCAGFTLIELLVVMAIIALLAAILFPVFAEARAKARQAACLSNLKQIGVAAAMYLQDYGTYVPKFPCAEHGDLAYPDHCTYPARNQVNSALEPADTVEWLPAAEAPPGTDYLLRPYVKNDDLRLCPSRVTSPPTAAGQPKNVSRYVLNGWDSAYSPSGRPETSPEDQTDAAVPNPATTLLVWEHEYNAGECQVGQSDGAGDPSATIDPDATPDHWFRGHQGGMNVLWCDGHARWQRLSQLQRRWFTLQED